MELCSLYMFTFQLTHGRSPDTYKPDGIHRQMVNMRLSNTRILIKHLIVERICQFSKIQIQNFSHTNTILLFV